MKLADPKQGEREYYQKIGEDGLRHARGKPFTDVKCGEYLADLGAMMSLLPPPPARGLDLGCGTGWTSFFLAQRGYEITGVDIAPETIAAAHERRETDNLTNAQFLCTDYEALSFRDEFDFAVFYGSLHHAEDEQLALRKVYEALRPGGCLLTFEPGKGHHETEASRHAVETYHVHEKEMHPARIIALARVAGFRDALVLPSPQIVHTLSYPPDAASFFDQSFAFFKRKVKATLLLTKTFLLPRHHGIVLLRK